MLLYKPQMLDDVVEWESFGNFRKTLPSNFLRKWWQGVQSL